jgi:hypothetical protein
MYVKKRKKLALCRTVKRETKKQKRADQLNQVLLRYMKKEEKKGAKARGTRYYCAIHRI